MAKKDYVNDYVHCVPIMNWLNKITEQNPFEYNGLLSSVKEQTMKITGCSSDKFEELRKTGFTLFLFEPEDRPIVDCYWQCFDNIRKVHQ